MNSLNVKKGDTVIVLAGKDKGKKGKVLTSNPKNETVTVEGINIVTKNVKPRGAQNPGGMQKTPGNTHVSNVMLVCPACGQPTRIAHKIEGKDSFRACKKCLALVDKAAKAAETKKKPAKKAKAAETAEVKTEEAEVKPKKAAKSVKKADKKAEEKA